VCAKGFGVTANGAIEGQTLLAKAREIAENVDRDVLGSLDEDETATLHALLRKILGST
jgi:DNA-binding MarR family transcriptional regulator